MASASRPEASPEVGRAGTVAEPVDWGFAEQIAHRVAGREPLADSYHLDSLESDFAEATSRAAELVSEFTGLEPAVEVAAGRVLDRQQWTTANLESFRRLLGPLTERIGERVASVPAAGFGRRIAAVEAGSLIGWFSRRVLGQYDLMDTDEAIGLAERAGPGSVGSVYYVGPNVLALEKRFGFRPRDFRLWIALHEVTHLVQFTGVPWLREYFLGLVDESLHLVEPDPRRLVEALRHVLDELRAGRNPLEGGGLLTLLAGEEQRATLARVQALMALLEGHGNFVMDRLGRDHVGDQERMSAALRERRRTRGVGGQVQKALGIELKLRQYAVGEDFFAGVEDRAGTAALDTLWEAPEALPDLDELRDPGRWLERTG